MFIRIIFVRVFTVPYENELCLFYNSFKAIGHISGGKIALYIKKLHSNSCKKKLCILRLQFWHRVLGHFNPAVTFGIMVTGQIGVIKGFLYIVVQFLGGIVGAAFLEV